MEDLSLNMQLFKESEGWKVIVDKLQEKITERRDILSWEALESVISKELNEVIWNRYDLLRLELNLLKELITLPDEIIRYNAPLIDVQKSSSY